jgi:hypothetical protein
LYHDLKLNICSDIALEAGIRNLGIYDLQPLIIELSSNSIPHLLDIIEKYGFYKIFNEKGSSAFEKYGAFTPEARLALSTILLIKKCKVITDSHISKLQKILHKRVKIDRKLSLTSPLAENIARTLHELRPNQFPKSILNSKTNHLENPEAFF